MRILQAATQGERDPERLHDQALKAFDVERPQSCRQHSLPKADTIDCSRDSPEYRDSVLIGPQTDIGFKPGSAEINSRGSICKAANISKGVLPDVIYSSAAQPGCRERRAAGPTLVSKCLLTVRAAQASSFVLGPAGIIFEKATPKLRTSSQCGYTLIGSDLARCWARIILRAPWNLTRVDGGGCAAAGPSAG
jgi:hypothetical protein